MKFEEVLPALRDGKKIRRKAYPLDYYICLEGNVVKAFNRLTGEIKLMSGDLKADDWEIVKEPKKIKLRDLTEKQFNKWIENYCAYSGDYCDDDCPFNIVDCMCLNDTCRIKHKDLFSDKFLDREIEVEE